MKRDSESQPDAGAGTQRGVAAKLIGLLGNVLILIGAGTLGGALVQMAVRLLVTPLQGLPHLPPSAANVLIRNRWALEAAAAGFLAGLSLMTARRVVWAAVLGVFVLLPWAFPLLVQPAYRTHALDILGHAALAVGVAIAAFLFGQWLQRRFTAPRQGSQTIAS